MVTKRVIMKIIFSSGGPWKPVDYAEYHRESTMTGFGRRQRARTGDPVGAPWLDTVRDVNAERSSPVSAVQVADRGSYLPFGKEQFGRASRSIYLQNSGRTH